MRKSKRLALELVQDRGLFFGERHLSFNILRHLCRDADDKTTCGDPDGLRVAQAAVRLAGRLIRLRRWCRRPAKSEALSLSFAQLAAALRLANRLDHAEAALQIAFEAASTHLTGDLLRRRGWLRLYQDRLPEALQDAEAAVEMATGQNLALALGTLGGMLHYSGEVPGAIARYRECLALLAPEDEFRYCGMVVSYSVVLADGTEADLNEGLNLCAKWRSKLKPRHKMQRAKLWWAQGLIQKKLSKLDDAWWSLDLARRSLVAMKASPEVAAIIADMSEIFVEPEAIGLICNEATTVIVETHPLAEPLQALACAARKQIPEAAAALRQQANKLAACPAL